MRQAPAVDFPVTRSRWHLRLVASLSLLGLLAGAAIAVNQSLSGVHLIVLACVVFAVSAVALRSWQRSPVGYLRWNAQEWFWSGFGDARPCRVILRLDAQYCMLLSLHGHGGSSDERLRAWLWLDAVPGPANVRWLALRRAVLFSHSHNQNLEYAP